MTQTPEGAKKAQQTILAKYGHDYYSKIGKKGADSYNAQNPKTRKPRGFAYAKAMGNDEKIRQAGSKGGSRVKDSI